MRLYQIRDIGFWLGTQAEAKAASKEHGLPWNECDVPTDKAGLMAFLAEHQVGKPSGIARPIAPPPVADTSKPGLAPMPEDAFEALPLAMQLHLAALALENARSRLKS